MNSIAVLIPQIIQLFVMLVLGYGIFRFKVIDINFNKQVTKFVLYVSMPCMILVSAINQVGKEKEISSVLFTFALAAGIYIIIAVIAFFICKIWRLPKHDKGIYSFVIIFSNLAFMGFPIANALLGDKGVFYASIFNMVSTILVFTYGVALTSIGSLTSPLAMILIGTTLAGMPLKEVFVSTLASFILLPVMLLLL